MQIERNFARVVVSFEYNWPPLPEWISFYGFVVRQYNQSEVFRDSRSLRLVEDTVIPVKMVRANARVQEEADNRRLKYIFTEGSVKSSRSVRRLSGMEHVDIYRAIRASVQRIKRLPGHEVQAMGSLDECQKHAARAR